MQVFGRNEKGEAQYLILKSSSKVKIIQCQGEGSDWKIIEEINSPLSVIAVNHSLSITPLK
jgi:hypothetical protein